MLCSLGYDHCYRYCHWRYLHTSERYLLLTFNKRLQFFFKPINILLQVIHAIHKPWHRFEHHRERNHIIRTKAGRLLNSNRGPGATSIWAKRMLSHDITEFYEVLNVYGTLISIYHSQGKISIVTRKHQGERVCYKTLIHIRKWVQRKKVVL
jgi:alcohol dehydrogenase YqhD (iron-dependent ADH family)